MERRGRAELIAQVAALASQANKLLAMLLADTGADGEQAPDIAPAAPAKSGRKGGVNTERETLKMADAVAFTGYSRGHLYRLVESGELPRRGRERGRLFFKRSELEELMLRKSRPANAEIADTATAILNGEAAK
ncbi:MAG: helix-turn-helix domain-containing protein [Treponema sp.]|jgi:predicted DNA-binding transcriptional regulator AlpA|nr:helix-turn-helix domain-containing protein [Treponema sp.]